MLRIGLIYNENIELIKLLVNALEYKWCISYDAIHVNNKAEVLVTFINEHDEINLDLFDLIVVNDNLQKELCFIYNNKINSDCFLILNVDIKENLKKIVGFTGILIDYGFSNKASVTASSISSGTINSFMICVQRDIPVKLGGIIFEQEFIFNTLRPVSDLYNVLSAASALLVLIPDMVLTGELLF